MARRLLTHPSGRSTGVRSSWPSTGPSIGIYGADRPSTSARYSRPIETSPTQGNSVCVQSPKQDQSALWRHSRWPGLSPLGRLCSRKRNSYSRNGSTPTHMLPRLRLEVWQPLQKIYRSLGNAWAVPGWRWFATQAPNTSGTSPHTYWTVSSRTPRAARRFSADLGTQLLRPWNFDGIWREWFEAVPKSTIEETEQNILNWFREELMGLCPVTRW